MTEQIRKIIILSNALRTNMLIGALLSGGNVLKLAKQMIKKEKIK